MCCYSIIRFFRRTKYECLSCKAPITIKEGYKLTCCNQFIHRECMKSDIETLELLKCRCCDKLKDQLLIQNVFIYILNKAQTADVFMLKNKVE